MLLNKAISKAFTTMNMTKHSHLQENHTFLISDCISAATLSEVNAFSIVSNKHTYTCRWIKNVCMYM